MSLLRLCEVKIGSKNLSLELIRHLLAKLLMSVSYETLSFYFKIFAIVTLTWDNYLLIAMSGILHNYGNSTWDYPNYLQVPRTNRLT